MKSMPLIGDPFFASLFCIWASAALAIESIPEEFGFSGFMNIDGISDDDYMSSFFDVDLRDSQRSGLNIYDADSGFKDVGCNIVAVYKWTDKWSVQTSGGLTRLLNDAGDSPVVDDRASITSNTYYDWMFDRAYLLVPAQATWVTF